MTYAFLRFLEKWIDEGRFPREELRARWWILAAGGIVVVTLGVALLIASS